MSAIIGLLRLIVLGTLGRARIFFVTRGRRTLGIWPRRLRLIRRTGNRTVAAGWIVRPADWWIVTLALAIIGRNHV